MSRTWRHRCGEDGGICYRCEDEAEEIAAGRARSEPSEQEVLDEADREAGWDQ